MIRSVAFPMVSFVILAAFLAGCGSSSSPSSPSTMGVTVTIPVGARSLGTGGYVPNPVTVSAGTTITWTNADSIPHTATSDTPGVFDSRSIAPGSMFSTTLQSRGTVTYNCTFHPGMVGTIVVQ